jgi:hypothetical protein
MLEVFNIGKSLHASRSVGPEPPVTAIRGLSFSGEGIIERVILTEEKLRRAGAGSFAAN